MSALRMGGLLSVLTAGLGDPSSAQSYFVDRQPIQTLGGTRPNRARVFGRIAGATRLASGVIVVGDGSANSLKFFDSRGRHWRTVSLPGPGPGQFKVLQWVKQCERDSLFAYDMMRRRISVFSASGRFVRQFQVPRMPSLVACSRDGTIGVLEGLRDEDVQVPKTAVALRRARVRLSTADTRGIIMRELGEVSAFDIVFANGSWWGRPGGTVASVAVGRDRLVVCPTDSRAVDVYDLGGARVRSILLRVPPRAPARRHLERSADAQLVFLPSGASRDAMREQLLRIPPPPYLPACNEVLIDPSDNAWVVLSAPGDSMTRLRILGRDGQLLSDATLAAEVEVLEVGSDYMLASGESVGGESWVAMYRVRRAAAR
jgi:hypothetical protein